MGRGFLCNWAGKLPFPLARSDVLQWEVCLIVDCRSFMFYPINSYDGKQVNQNARTEGYGWRDLTGSGVKAAFVKSGLGAR